MSKGQTWKWFSLIFLFSGSAEVSHNKLLMANMSYGLIAIYLLVGHFNFNYILFIVFLFYYKQPQLTEHFFSWTSAVKWCLQRQHTKHIRSSHCCRWSGVYIGSVLENMWYNRPWQWKASSFLMLTDHLYFCWRGWRTQVCTSLPQLLQHSSAERRPLVCHAFTATWSCWLCETVSFSHLTKFPCHLPADQLLWNTQRGHSVLWAELILKIL